MFCVHRIIVFLHLVVCLRSILQDFFFFVGWVFFVTHAHAHTLPFILLFYSLQFSFSVCSSIRLAVSNTSLRLCLSYTDHLCIYLSVCCIFTKLSQEEFSFHRFSLCHTYTHTDRQAYTSTQPYSLRLLVAVKVEVEKKKRTKKRKKIKTLFLLIVFLCTTYILNYIRQVKIIKKRK